MGTFVPIIDRRVLGPGMLGSIKFEVRPCVANWKHASRSEGKASLGEKPLEEEEASVESFEDIIVDKRNKEDFHNLFFPW